MDTRVVRGEFLRLFVERNCKVDRLNRIVTSGGHSLGQRIVACTEATEGEFTLIVDKTLDSGFGLIAALLRESGNLLVFICRGFIFALIYSGSAGIRCRIGIVFQLPIRTGIVLFKGAFADENDVHAIASQREFCTGQDFVVAVSFGDGEFRGVGFCLNLWSFTFGVFRAGLVVSRIVVVGIVGIDKIDLVDVGRSTDFCIFVQRCGVGDKNGSIFRVLDEILQYDFDRGRAVAIYRVSFRTKKYLV